MAKIEMWAAVAIAAVMLMVGCYLGGYQRGESHTRLSMASVQVEETTKQIKKQEVLQVVASDADKLKTEQKEKIVTVYKTITKEIIKYEKINVSPVYLDADWVRIFNASSTSCDPTAATCNPDASLSGLTLSDALRTSSEQHELYQDCRTTVEGWQSFYTKLKETHDDK